MPRRTLSRHLSRLVNNGQLITTGKLKSTRYLPKPKLITGTAHVSLPALQGSATGEVYIPISEEGEAVRKAIRKPIQSRIPVGYNHELLESYRPNESFYLSSETREELRAIGQAPETTQPAGTYAHDIFDRLLIDLSWSSSRLEGNTYSLLDTERLIANGEAAEGKDQSETQMILNHKAAIEFLVESASEIGFNRYTILNLHALLSDNLLADPALCGQIRKRSVGIHETVFHPLEVPQQIEESFDQVLATVQAITDPFEQSFFMMVHIPYLQPFIDVNKRVSRLAANIPMVCNNLCPISFIDVPEKAYIDGLLGIYELNRIELLRDVYIWAYKRSAQKYQAIQSSLGEPDPFRMKYRELLAELIGYIVRNPDSSENELISDWAKTHIIENDLKQFISMISIELDGLHEGNIARYRLMPSEYTKWINIRKSENS